MRRARIVSLFSRAAVNKTRAALVYPVLLAGMVAKEQLEATVAMPDFIAELKTLSPKNAAWLDAKLAKYNEGKLGATQVYALMRTEIAYDTLMDAFEKRVTGFKKVDMIKNYQHPILV